MAKINFTDTKIEGLKIVEPFYAEDDRGYFMKAYEREIFREAGIETDITETFESFSRHGVVRGLHFQPGEKAQSKLIRVLDGEVYDVCVDIRVQSLTLGQWVGEYLSGKNHKALFVPKGFAHGFLVTGEHALMSYTCSGEYSKEGESGIYYNSPELQIDWPIVDMKVIQSARDANLQTFHEYRVSVGI